MNDKESIKQILRQISSNFSEEEIEAHAEFMVRKNDTLKSGDDVVHLSYYSSLFDKSEINKLETILAESNLQLSRYDKTGVAYAALEDFMLQVSLALNDSIVQTLSIGIGTNAIWDTIKKSSFLIWQAVRNKTTLKSAITNNEKKINIGIKASIDKHTHFDFKIDGTFSEELAIEAIDGILDFLKIARPAESTKRPEFVIFDKDTKQWIIIDVDAEIKKLILKSREIPPNPQ